MTKNERLMLLKLGRMNVQLQYSINVIALTIADADAKKKIQESMEIVQTIHNELVDVMEKEWESE